MRYIRLVWRNPVISGDILGLISIERIPSEWRIHIRLLSVSRENMGKKRKYMGIAGKLITFVGKLALQEYGNFAKDMDITPVALRNVLNDHREPKIEFLQRLMIHSALVYQCIIPFKNTTWFQVYYLGKIHDTFSEESR